MDRTSRHSPAKLPRFDSAIHGNNISLQQAILERRLDFHKGVKQLERRGRSGLTIAAGLLLEAAWHTHNVEDAAELIQHSSLNYERVISEKVNHYIDQDQSSALIRLAQMPLYAAIISTGELPDRAIVQQSYSKTLQVGQVLAEEHEHVFRDRQQEKPGSKSALGELRGNMSELSVLLLGQRFALRADICDEWLPLLSQFSADHSTRRRAQSTSAYDIDIFMQHGNKPIESAYQLQVKTTKNDCFRTNLPAYKSVSVVHVIPDLARSNERIRVPTIINECAMETYEERAQINLDYRSDRLLDLIDQQQ
ncbi:MAG: hypothetical protein NVS1B7_6170 [Candidatus Saccharimonadales bacterium]